MNVDYQISYRKILPIVTVDKTNPKNSVVLRKVAAKVTDPTIPEIQQIIANMIATAEMSPNTVGLAAPQINISLSIFIYRNNASRRFIPIINPEIEVVDNNVVLGREGCLSIPDYMGIVPRYRAIRYTYQDLQGTTITKTATGYQARIIQHEFNHLHGVLYTDLINIGDPDQFGVIDLMRTKKIFHSIV